VVCSICAAHPLILFYVRAALNFLGILLANIAYLFGVRKKITAENLRNAFPELSGTSQKRIARRAYTNLGIVFAEMLYLRFASRKNIAKYISISNPELFHASLAKRKGLIVIAGHFANWEWLALGGALALKTNFAVVRKNIQTSFTERFLETMRLRTGNALINAGDIRKMYRFLQNDGCIALLGDQAAPGESTRVKFFGREVPTFEGPARLALRTRTPMLFAECLRLENNDYRITFYPIQFDDITGDTDAHIHELTYRHTHLLEEIIRKHPDQWLWQHRRWKYV
jgi:KDO2-lipid IV(A) lauroyltransferase